MADTFVRERDGVPKARLLHTRMPMYQKGAILTPLRDRSVATAVEDHLVHHSFGKLIYKKGQLVAQLVGAMNGTE
jgi:hypothetical protein